MYYYKKSYEDRVRYVVDTWIKIDPFEFFALDPLTISWCHKNDEGVIDFYWPHLQIESNEVGNNYENFS